MEWRRHIARCGDRWFPGEIWVKWTFALLMALAGVLRLWGLSNLPFTHDELSALMRLYPTLTETIQRGVVELDTHPPGVHVFEWGWTRLFGTSEAAVKLPFILAAWTGIYFFFRCAIAWTSAATALVTAALLATLQYTVLYAQIARPYAMGFFTIALLADQLTRYLAFGTARQLFGIGIAAVLSAYVHHFSLLLAGIMVASVIPLLRRDQFRAFFLMSAAAALAYSPNLPIFFKQLGLGGLGGWLQPPDAGWIPGYLRWILHFWPPLMLVTATLVATSAAMALFNGRSGGPGLILLPLWGLAPLVIGYAYSVWRSPVLQYSMLLFSFPFILVWLFSGLRHAPRWVVLSACGVLISLSTYSLIVERKHYIVFSDTPYAAVVRVAAEHVKSDPTKRTLVIVDAPRPQVEFHVRRHGLDSLVDIQWARDPSVASQLDHVLSDARWDRVVLGTSNGCREDRVAQVRSHFSLLEYMEDHVEGQVHVLTRAPGKSTVLDRTKLTELSPSRRAGRVDVRSGLDMMHDPVTRTSSWNMDGYEFGLGLSVPLNDLGYDCADLFEAEMSVSGMDEDAYLLLVFELRDARGETLIYKASGADFSSDTVIVTAALSPSWTSTEAEPTKLHVYAQNKNKGAVQVHHLRLYRREHNPVENALLAPLTSLGHRPINEKGR